MRALATCLLLLGALPAGAADFAYVPRVEARGVVIVDSRPLADCKRASLPGARCLPAGDFLGSRGQLPSERDILWLLGTAGLDGRETVLVVGQDATARDFVAGLLHLAGQKEVRVLSEPLARLPDSASPGQERGMIRSAVYTAPMRDHLWLVNQREVDAVPADRRILAPDAYTAISRFARHLAGGGQPVRVGWNSALGSANQ